MITGIVNSSELSTKSLRAGDYLVDPAKTAKNFLRTWLKASELNKLLKVSSPQLKGLEEMLQQLIRIFYEKGQKQKAQEVDNLHKALAEATNEVDGGAIANMLLALGRLRGILGAHAGDDRAKGDFQSIIDAASFHVWALREMVGRECGDVDGHIKQLRERWERGER